MSFYIGDKNKATSATVVTTTSITTSLGVNWLAALLVCAILYALAIDLIRTRR